LRPLSAEAPRPTLASSESLIIQLVAGELAAEIPSLLETLTCALQRGFLLGRELTLAGWLRRHDPRDRPALRGHQDLNPRFDIRRIRENCWFASRADTDLCTARSSDQVPA
jgi:hypothetical protein